MPKAYFDFKKFRIFHDKCAMKVGTDGVLLGAWSCAGSEHRVVLDVGTGSGLIAIMLAQKTQAVIWGVDIDENAVIQANENAAATEWSDRLHFLHSDISSFSPDFQFDLLVSNPPFFSRSLKCPDGVRSQARHTDSMSFGELIGSASRLLAENGRFEVVLPAERADEFVHESWINGLNLERKTLVYTKEGQTEAKRVLLGFLKGECSYPSSDKLYIRCADGEYTEEYKSMTADYYLHY